jgi:hypothetical protein
MDHGDEVEFVAVSGARHHVRLERTCVCRLSENYLLDPWILFWQMYRDQPAPVPDASGALPRNW